MTTKFLGAQQTHISKKGTYDNTPAPGHYDMNDLSGDTTDKNGKQTFRFDTQKRDRYERTYVPSQAHCTSEFNCNTARAGFPMGQTDWGERQADSRHKSARSHAFSSTPRSKHSRRPHSTAAVQLIDKSSMGPMVDSRNGDTNPSFSFGKANVKAYERQNLGRKMNERMPNQACTGRVQYTRTDTEVTVIKRAAPKHSWGSSPRFAKGNGRQGWGNMYMPPGM